MSRIERFQDWLRVVCLWVLACCVVGCGTTQTLAREHPYPDPPKWVENLVVYEVNLRQFSQPGTLDAFRKELPRLKELGVGVLWFMPIHPIGVEGRSGTLGSPYAVKDYKAFNPEFGTLDEFKQTVQEAHDLGMYVIIDWVANHTSHDHPWIKQHPDWFTRDENGGLVPPIELWKDVVDLNFDEQGLREAMIDAMAFWVREVDIDGFRCDTAEWVPLDFWVGARDALWQIKPVFMLGEGAKPELIEYAFDAAYAWSLTPNMNEIKAGTKSVTDLVNYLNAEARIVPGNGFRLNFTTNHDINSWEGTAVERLGEGLETFTVLTFTIEGMPLIYNGQEARLDNRLEFFEREPINWREDSMAELYRTLSELKRKNPALWHGNSGGRLEVIDYCTTDSVLAYQRMVKGNRVVVVLNLSNDPQIASLPAGVYGMQPVFTKNAPKSTNGKLKLQPWSYQVWTESPKRD